VLRGRCPSCSYMAVPESSPRPAAAKKTPRGSRRPCPYPSRENLIRLAIVESSPLGRAVSGVASGHILRPAAANRRNRRSSTGMRTLTAVQSAQRSTTSTSTSGNLRLQFWLTQGLAIRTASAKFSVGALSAAPLRRWVEASWGPRARWPLARAQRIALSTNVCTWWKRTCERHRGVRVLTHLYGPAVRPILL
jgi:hypothetical protein